MEKKDFIKILFEKGVLVKPEHILNLSESDYEQIIAKIDINSETSLSDIVNKIKELKKIKDLNEKPKIQINIGDVERRVKIVKNYVDPKKKREVKDFVMMLRHRYDNLSKILRNRKELSSAISINRVANKAQNEEAVVIGMINSIVVSKNGHIILTIEDPTGTVKVLVNKNKKELFEFAKDLVMDEVIGVVGNCGENILFVKTIHIPDIPLNREFKKSGDEVYMAVLSDIQLGVKSFMREEFEKFISWLNCEVGNDDQKNIASKVKYLIIAGDAVDGIGVYPGQEKELLIGSIEEQYNELARLLSKIPKHIEIIYSPGNHDAVRIAEPQPTVSRKYASSLWNLPNITMTTNPGWVNIHSSERFSGFDLLIYHGFSYFYYADKVESLRNAGALTKMDLVMKYLLQKRHMAPTHTSNQYIPDPEMDFLVIDPIPDFFISGHVHKSAVSTYRSTTLICGSCWDSESAYASRFGNIVEPARVPLVNLQTREVKILKFINEDKDETESAED